ncbi:MAG: substrate-binding domain-containing protein [Planctomycetota bacterium]
MPEPRAAASPAALAYRYRVYLLLIGISLAMSVIAPNYLTTGNLRNIFKAAATNIPALAGFTVVMIAGQLDLSVGAIMTLGGMLAIGLEPGLGLAGSCAVALLSGTALGACNGVLVAVAKINSFIVTLGSMIMVRNIVFIYGRSGTILARSFEVADWCQRPLVLGVPPEILLPFGVVAVLSVALTQTPWGRGFYLLGGNRQTAWYSGLNVTWYTVSAFALSGSLSALGGSIVAIGAAGANPYLGDNSLMLIVAAAIVGGTAMQGGQGSLLQTGIALLALTALTKGLDCCGAGHEIHLLASGVVLALVIVFDAYALRKREALRGQRRALMPEVAGLLKQRWARQDTAKGSTERKDNSLALACVTIAGCVALVAICAMFLLSRQHAVKMAQAPGTSTNSQTSGTSATPQSSGQDRLAAELKSDDNQPLLIVDTSPLTPPQRPFDPLALPEDDAGRWYDLEYAGWRCTRINPVPSPANGARGKKVVCLRHMDHPYTTAYSRGMKKVADVYSIELKTLTAGNADVNIQSQQVDQAINEKPDLVIIFPVDAKSVVPMLRRLNQAGIPTIASNLMPVDEGMPYLLAWTGPDDWGQFRMLAREFAKRMNFEGGYCVVQHMPGGSPFFSRTYSVITELKKIAPKMKVLEKQTTMLEAEKSAQVVGDWLTKYGKELKGIVSADDSGVQIGINEAVKNAKREDLIRVAAGNSKVGMDFINEGRLHAVTYQSAEADGALPMKLAVDWFNGKPLNRTVYYLPKHVITKDDVGRYMPAQW